MANNLKNTRSSAKKNGVSTRDSIVDKAREIINKGGVIDFRIETLAVSLGLSPGNITYHFPRKEDIINAIWENSNQQADNLLEQLTMPLLDIKQLFLVFRSTANNSLEYLGVRSFYNGDVGNLKRRSQSNRDYISAFRKSMFEAYDILHSNGYIEKISDDMLKDMTFKAQFIVLRWWSNLSMLEAEYDKIKSDIDKYCLNAIYPLMPYFTESGHKQYDSIYMMINKKIG